MIDIFPIQTLITSLSRKVMLTMPRELGLHVGTPYIFYFFSGAEVAKGMSDIQISNLKFHISIGLY